MLDNIDAIVFDLGGVLLNLDFGKTEQAFVNAGLSNFKQYFALGHADAIFRDYETGAITDEQFVEGMVKLTNGKLTPETALAAWNAMLLDFPAERVELLEKLSRHKRIFLYSNTNAIHHAFFIAAFHEVYGKSMDGLFEKAYYSHLIGHRKPDTSGFEYIAADVSLDPERTLFIDDAAVNVEGARKAGWQAYWLQPGDTVNRLFDPLIS